MKNEPEEFLRIFLGHEIWYQMKINGDQIIDLVLRPLSYERDELLRNTVVKYDSLLYWEKYCTKFVETSEKRLIVRFASLISFISLCKIRTRKVIFHFRALLMCTICTLFSAFWKWMSNTPHNEAARVVWRKGAPIGYGMEHFGNTDNSPRSRQRCWF